MFWNIVSLVTVAFLWGATNPLIRHSSKGVDTIKADSKIMQFLLELKFLILNWKYVLSFLLNQSGSLLYVFTLQNTELSLAVPVANSLSFVFTGIVGNFMGEQKSSWKIYAGMALIIAGTTICAIDKIYSS